MAKTKWRHLTRRQKIRRAASTSAPATPKPAPVTLTPQQQELAWYHGQGGQAFTVVQNTLGTTTTDLSTAADDPTVTNLERVDIDGAMLSVTAKVAEGYPPPVDRSLYVTSMGEVSRVGTALSAGDYATATADLQTADAGFQQMTADLPG